MTAAGGDGGSDNAAPPTDASTEEFCGNFGDLLADLGKLDPDAEASEAVAVLKEAGDQLAETGTPEDMPEAARAGFDLVLEEIDKLDDDATREDVSNLGADVSPEQEDDMDAYEKYLQDTCADELSGGATVE